MKQKFKVGDIVGVKWTKTVKSFVVFEVKKIQRTKNGLRYCLDDYGIEWLPANKLFVDQTALNQETIKKILKVNNEV